MEKSRVISIRVSEDLLAKMEVELKKHSYWKRNTVIAQMIMAFFEDLSEQDRYNIFRQPYGFNKRARSHKLQVSEF